MLSFSVVIANCQLEWERIYAGLLLFVYISIDRIEPLVRISVMIVFVLTVMVYNQQILSSYLVVS